MSDQPLSVLGLDAAWTERQPSGVALVVQVNGEWRCLAAAPSIESFIALANGVPVDWHSPRFSGWRPHADLLAACQTLLGGAVPSVVAVDMPLANGPIVGRRSADNALSSAFSRYGAAAHSPSAERPGRIADDLHAFFRGRGYSLGTRTEEAGQTGKLLEVYPHPALLRLLDEPYRLQYKVSRASQYWPAARGFDLAHRHASIQANLLRINVALEREITGACVPLATARTRTLSGLKRYEDTLDALICCWIGIRFLGGEAEAFGNDHAAIWVPR
jgi:predicted RNase H-like nuclease